MHGLSLGGWASLSFNPKIAHVQGLRSGPLSFFRAKHVYLRQSIYEIGHGAHGSLGLSVYGVCGCAQMFLEGRGCNEGRLWYSNCLSTCFSVVHSSVVKKCKCMHQRKHRPTYKKKHTVWAGCVGCYLILSSLFYFAVKDHPSWNSHKALESCSHCSFPPTYKSVSVTRLKRLVCCQAGAISVEWTSSIHHTLQWKNTS